MSVCKYAKQRLPYEFSTVICFFLLSNVKTEKKTLKHTFKLSEKKIN